MQFLYFKSHKSNKLVQLKSICTKHIKFLPGGGAGGPAGVVEVSSPVPGEIYIYFF